MVRLPNTALSLSLAAATVVCGATVSETWSLTAQKIAPDGFTRSAELVNGLFPGPLLTANKGDTIMVNVTNNLLDPTMRRSTSIVRNFYPFMGYWCFLAPTKSIHFFSTGTGLYAQYLFISCSLY